MFGNGCWSVTAGRVCLLVLSAAGPVLTDAHRDPAGLTLPREQAAEITPLEYPTKPAGFVVFLPKQAVRPTLVPVPGSGGR